MAEFYTTQGITVHLKKIIDEADKELILISPYIKADSETKDLLKDKKRTTTIHVVYGKKELGKDEKGFLDALGIKSVFLENLHAKCYLNEKEALLTSMNLYKFSQENNDEMGILVSQKDDAELYGAIYRQARRWIDAVSGVEVKETSKARGSGKPTRQNLQPDPGIPSKGFCIRCKGVISADPSQPYCRRCYTSWKRSANKAYQEKHCHTCGSEHTSTLLKPVCLSCYRMYKDVFEFAVG